MFRYMLCLISLNSLIEYKSYRLNLQTDYGKIIIFIKLWCWEILTNLKVGGVQTLFLSIKLFITVKKVAGGGGGGGGGGGLRPLSLCRPCNLARPNKKICVFPVTDRP